jgi:protein-tyrosine phosphatase
MILSARLIANLDAAFEEMEKRYGTIEKYFSEGLGIDAEQQKALRDLYLR